MKNNTKTRILDAAEQLFAERGFTDTSLRLITGRAEVNLASVNYHFGSKKELIQSVMARYLERFMPDLKSDLKAFLDDSAEPSLQQVFNIFVEPLLRLNDFRSGGTAIFLNLLGRGYSDEQGHLRWYLTSQYGDVLELINKAVRTAYPELPQSELFWRLHFTLGTAIFTMASSDALRDIAQADFDQQFEVEDLIRHLVPYIAAGVGAPVKHPLQQ